MPEGPLNAKIMIIGEAWGAREAACKPHPRPFIGPAGQLLDKLLLGSGIARARCRITNVIQAKPKGNSIDTYLSASKGEIYYQHVDTGTHIERLHVEIADVNPNIIIALGRIPLAVLSQEGRSSKAQTSITDWRGSITPYPRNPQIKILHTFHPASALPDRNPTNAYFIQHDLKKAAQHSTYYGPVPDDREYITSPSFAESCEYLRECAATPIIGSDIENTANKEVSCVSFALSSTSAISIPFIGGPKEPYFSPPQEAEIIRLMALAYESTPSIWHNAPYDIRLLVENYGFRFKDIHCTRIAMGVLYPDLFTSGGDDDELDYKRGGMDQSGQRKSLSVLQSLFSTLPFHKDEGRDGGPNYGNRYWTYSCKDSIVLNECLPKVIERLEATGNIETYNRQRRLLEPLVFNSIHGLAIEEGGLDRLRSKLNHKCLILEKHIRDAVGNQKFNPRSWVQRNKYFYVEQKHYKYLNKGKPTTDKFALNKLRGSDRKEIHEPATLLLKYSDKRTALGNSNILLVEGRVVTQMDPIGTRYSRTSSRAMTYEKKRVGRPEYGTNIQNMPSELKQLLIPEPGYVLYKADGAKAETYVVAYDGGVRSLMDALEGGVDIHSFYASLMFGGPPTSEYQTSHKPPEGLGRHTARAIGKMTGHAYDYGITGIGLAMRLGIPPTRGKVLLGLIEDAIPGVDAWHEQLKRQFFKDRTITNLLGRKYTFYSTTGRGKGADWAKSRNNIYSFIPQSTVGDLVNGVYSWIYYKDVWCRDIILSLLEHDGFYFQIPLSVGWSKHSNLLNIIRGGMQRPLQCPNGNSFSIPCDLTMLPHNFDSKGAGARELEEIGSEYLEETYREATHDI